MSPGSASSIQRHLACLFLPGGKFTRHINIFAEDGRPANLSIRAFSRAVGRLWRGADFGPIPKRIRAVASMNVCLSHRPAPMRDQVVGAARFPHAMVNSLFVGEACTLTK